jgi:hypothetical protein
MGLRTMAFFEDMSVYEYSFDQPESGVVNVGWLGEGQPFQTGSVPKDFQTALKELCNNNSINHCMGHHVCEFCPDASWGDSYYMQMGNGEIRVRDAGGIWYVAPRLVIHYVEEHNYFPPQEFIDAVVNPSEIGKEPETPELSEEEEIEQIREFERCEKEQRGLPITQSEIDEMVQRGIKEKHLRKPWWRFW